MSCMSSLANVIHDGVMDFKIIRYIDTFAQQIYRIKSCSLQKKNTYTEYSV